MRRIIEENDEGSRERCTYLVGLFAMARRVVAVEEREVGEGREVKFSERKAESHK